MSVLKVVWNGTFLLKKDKNVLKLLIVKVEKWKISNLKI